VVARVKAVLRRINPEQTGNNLVLGVISIDKASHQAWASGQLLDLTPSEFRLMQVLVSQPGRVFFPG
jgi:DNA-binding response OmpR family regulator